MNLQMFASAYGERSKFEQNLTFVMFEQNLFQLKDMLTYLHLYCHIYLFVNFIHVLAYVQTQSTVFGRERT